MSNQTYEDLIERANHGDMKAQCSLGLRYHLGIGVEQDNEKAQEWLIKAADQGDACAFYQIQTLKFLGLSKPKGEQ